MGKNQFDKDFKEAKMKFPELEYTILLNEKFRYRVDGIIKIIDSEGSQRGAFRVSIYFKNNYPLGFALLQETSNVIPRIIDRHVDETGGCCICGPITQARNELKPFTILKFVQDYAIPFFANYIHFDEYGYYKNGEYSHYGKGLWESFEEEFNTTDPEKLKSILQYIGSKPGVNTQCYCESGRKLKHCHLDTQNLIASILKKL